MAPAHTGLGTLNRVPDGLLRPTSAAQARFSSRKQRGSNPRHAPGRTRRGRTRDLCTLVPLLPNRPGVRRPRPIRRPPGLPSRPPRIMSTPVAFRPSTSAVHPALLAVLCLGGLRTGSQGHPMTRLPADRPKLVPQRMLRPQSIGDSPDDVPGNAPRREGADSHERLVGRLERKDINQDGEVKAMLIQLDSTNVRMGDRVPPARRRRAAGVRRRTVPFDHCRVTEQRHRMGTPSQESPTPDEPGHQRRRELPHRWAAF
jgi:hypothetical protein